MSDEVVCIVSHSQGAVKKGVIYPLISIRKCPCGCGQILFDVGIEKATLSKCYKTQTVWDSGKVWWIASDLFAPLQTASEEADMKEAIEESLCQPATL